MYCYYIGVSYFTRHKRRLCRAPTDGGSVSGSKAPAGHTGVTHKVYQQSVATRAQHWRKDFTTELANQSVKERVSIIHSYVVIATG